MLNTAAGLHLTSDAELRMVSDIAPRVPRFVVPNVVNTSFWQAPGDPGGFRARYVRGTREPIVAFIGRITPKKRVDILVDAVARLSDRGVTLVIAGADDSGLRPHLDRQIEALGVRDRVVFTGHLDPTEARSLLKAASAWVLPSETENFGMAVVEAMAAGVPVIISSGVGLAPDAAKADAAIVLGSLSAGEVCARLEEVLQSPELRRSIREGGASFAARFEGEEVARGLATMYEAVVRSSVSGIGGGVSTRGLTS
jgi:glycosyltransferase involved in cell wall biosynthesis